MVTIACVLALALPALVGVSPGAARADQRCAEWGRETLEQIRSDLYMPERGLYAEEAALSGDRPRQPAFMWGCGVQLAALAAAARLDRAYREPLRGYAEALQSYWSEARGIGGYDVLPVPKPSDRYYDDNAWVVLAMLDAREATGEERYRELAERAMAFVLSGEDERLGGGIWWREEERRSKNTCSSAPAIVGALRLFRLTGKRRYRDAADRLHRWTKAHLQDTDGLYFDNVRLDGTVEPTKWSYNTAVMIDAECMLYAITRERRYRDEALRVARAARARWVRETGAVADEGRFARLLLEALLDVDALDRRGGWRATVQRCLAHLHTEVRDARGRYGGRWDRTAGEPVQRFSLLDQASAARAYWAAAKAP
ncbi:MAG: AGE family epimerase/isomerase [Chthonomonadales bacterium]|nr:AGE family epimerase/isomerase [Chthonomonadales bacterium]